MRTMLINLLRRFTPLREEKPPRPPRHLRRGIYVLSFEGCGLFNKGDGGEAQVEVGELDQPVTGLSRIEVIAVSGVPRSLSRQVREHVPNHVAEHNVRWFED